MKRSRHYQNNSNRVAQLTEFQQHVMQSAAQRPDSSYSEYLTLFGGK